MKVYLIGVGMGNRETMTTGALAAVGECPVLVGALNCHYADWSPH